MRIPTTIRLLSILAATAAVSGLAAKEPTWIIGTGEVPHGAVYAGSENEFSYYVCRGEYMNGLHPGKLHAGKCNIEFNFGEVVLDTYEVLLEESDLVRWVPDSLGAAPPDAFPVGSEDGSTVYSCAAEVWQKDEFGTVIGSFGIHSGKMRASNCNIPYGGGAYLTDRYSVLVLLNPTAVKPERKSFVPRATGLRKAGSYDLNGRSLVRSRSGAAAGAIRISP
jgi:hypothetical protein